MSKLVEIINILIYMHVMQTYKESTIIDKNINTEYKLKRGV